MECQNKTRKGGPWLRKLLEEAASAASHTKNTSLSAFYQRIKGCQGANQAVLALGHPFLVTCSHVLDREVCSEELGGNDLDEQDRQVTEKTPRAVSRASSTSFS